MTESQFSLKVGLGCKVTVSKQPGCVVDHWVHGDVMVVNYMTPLLKSHWQMHTGCFLLMKFIF